MPIPPTPVTRRTLRARRVTHGRRRRLGAGPAQRLAGRRTTRRELRKMRRRPLVRLVTSKAGSSESAPATGPTTFQVPDSPLRGPRTRTSAPFSMVGGCAARDWGIPPPRLLELMFGYYAGADRCVHPGATDVGWGRGHPGGARDRPAGRSGAARRRDQRGRRRWLADLVPGVARGRLPGGAGQRDQHGGAVPRLP